MQGTLAMDFEFQLDLYYVSIGRNTREVFTHLPIGSCQGHAREDPSSLRGPVGCETDIPAKGNCQRCSHEKDTIKYLLISPDHRVASEIKPAALEIRIKVWLSQVSTRAGSLENVRKHDSQRKNKTAVIVGAPYRRKTVGSKLFDKQLGPRHNMLVNKREPTGMLLISWSPSYAVTGTDVRPARYSSEEKVRRRMVEAQLGSNWGLLKERLGVGREGQRCHQDPIYPVRRTGKVAERKSERKPKKVGGEEKEESIQQGGSWECVEVEVDRCIGPAKVSTSKCGARTHQPQRKLSILFVSNFNAHIDFPTLSSTHNIPRWHYSDLPPLRQGPPRTSRLPLCSSCSKRRL